MHGKMDKVMRKQM